MTFDLDVVHSTEEANVVRLLVALGLLDAFYRTQAERKIKPDASHLGSSRRQLLMTRYGQDLLGAIRRGHTYRDLSGRAVRLQIANNLTVPMLDLASLIAIKEETAGEKDQAVLPVLRRTLRERT